MDRKIVKKFKVGNDILVLHEGTGADLIRANAMETGEIAFFLASILMTKNGHWLSVAELRTAPIKFAATINSIINVHVFTEGGKQSYEELPLDTDGGAESLSLPQTISSDSGKSGSEGMTSST